MIKDVKVTDETLSFIFEDGRMIRVPLSWYPRLLNANDKQKSTWEHCNAGYGIYWPFIDEHLSAEGLLFGNRDASAVLESNT